MKRNTSQIVLKEKSELLLKIAEKLPVANIILIKTYINNLISNYYKPELIWLYGLRQMDQNVREFILCWLFLVLIVNK